MTVSPDLLAVLSEARRLALAMQRAAAALHGRADPARRAVLELLRTGSSRIPALARRRRISRQRARELVDALAADGLVALGPDPDHRRAVRVELTAAGRAALAEAKERESPVLASLAGRLPPADLAVAARSLRALRETLEG